MGISKALGLSGTWHWSAGPLLCSAADWVHLTMQATQTCQIDEQPGLQSQGESQSSREHQPWLEGPLARDHDQCRTLPASSTHAGIHSQLAAAVTTAEALGSQLQQSLGSQAEAEAALEACQAELAACRVQVLAGQADLAALRAHRLADQADLPVSVQVLTGQADHAAPGRPQSPAAPTQCHQQLATSQQELAACQAELQQCRQQLAGSRAHAAAAGQEAQQAQQAVHACQMAGAHVQAHVRQLEASYTAAREALEEQREAGLAQAADHGKLVSRSCQTVLVAYKRQLPAD